MSRLNWSSGIFSVFLALGLALQWQSAHNSYKPNEGQLESATAAGQYLKAYFADNLDINFENTYRSPVGLFVESAKFISSNDVEISGYIWQKIYKTDGKARFEPGLIFVDAVGGVTFEKRYNKISKEYDLHGWYFEVNLRQSFDYRDYPIDHKTLWIKIKPTGFNQRQILLPDLNSYAKTRKGDIFGVSPDIVLSGWELVESFFDYRLSGYDTDFGLDNANHATLTPNLAFNIVLNRQLLHAFMINITLLLVTMLLLYVLAIMITSDGQLKTEFDMTVGGAIGSCTGLFFAVLLAHIHLREQFPSAGFVYLEFFYLVNYSYIVVIALIIFAFYSRKSAEHSLMFKNDAQRVKLLFWPVYFLILNIYTLVHFSR